MRRGRCSLSNSLRRLDILGTKNRVERDDQAGLQFHWLRIHLSAIYQLWSQNAEGGSDNRHRGSDQWLYVVSGTGQATIEGRRHPLRAGTLLCIQRGERHEVRNTGRSLLKTVNVYVPPAYDRSGEPLPRGRK